MRSLRPAFALLSCLALLPGCAPSGTDAASGARVFKQCASCHQVGVNAHGGFGPQLNGVLGRRAGATPDYAYSDAMRRSNIVWDERTLAAFLRDPDKVVPGTRMRFWGIGNANEIAALQAYLRSFAPDGGAAGLSK